MSLDQNSLYAAMPVGTGLGFPAGPARLDNGQLRGDTAENDVHRGFIIDFNNTVKESAQRAIEVTAEQEIVARKKEASDDDMDMVIDEAKATMERLQDERLERLTDFQFGDFHFDNEDIDNAIKSAKDDKDQFYQDMRDKGMDDAQIDILYAHLLAMDGMTQEERDAYLRDLQARDPGSADIVFGHLEELHQMEFAQNAQKMAMTSSSFAEELEGSSAGAIVKPAAAPEEGTQFASAPAAPSTEIDFTFG